MPRLLSFEEEKEEDDIADDDEDHRDEDRARYYTLLGLNRNCSAEDVHRAYKLLSRVFHPDKTTLSGARRSSISTGSGSYDDLASTAESTFVDLQYCVAVLSDRVLRLAYDTGGATAVRLVLQSQSRQQQQPQVQYQANTAEEESCTTNLYENMANAKSNDAAIFLLQQALNEYRHLQREHQQYAKRGQGGGVASSAVTHFDAFLYAPYSDWERESSALTLSLKRHLSPHKSISLSTSHRLQHRGFGHVAASVGCECVAVPAAESSEGAGQHRHGSGTTTYAADARFTTTGSSSSDAIIASHKQNKRKRNSFMEAPYLSFRTSRQLASGTTVMLGLSGRFPEKKTWNYTVSSSRFLQYFRDAATQSGKRRDDEEEESSSSSVFRGVMATWKLGLHCTTGRLGFAIAQLRTVASPATSNASSLSVPQYLLRLSATNPYPVKVTYRGGSSIVNDGSLVVAYSIGWWNWWNRLKVTWCRRVGGGRFMCQYGLKYDGRAIADLSAGEIALWTLLLHVHSNEWSIRIPIYLTATAGVMPSSAASMVTILVSQWLEAQLEQWTMKQQQEQQRKMEQQVTAESAQWKSETGSLTTILLQTLPHVMHQTAAKKRMLERKIDGLVIVSVSVDGSQQMDLTDLLQFWVVQSTLMLPTKDVLLQFDTQQFHHESPWWKRWLPSFPSLAAASSAHTHHSNVPRRLDVRYQHRGFVYDTFFTSDDDRIVIPNNDAARSMRLGRANQVY